MGQALRDAACNCQRSTYQIVLHLQVACIGCMVCSLNCAPLRCHAEFGIAARRQCQQARSLRLSNDRAAAVCIGAWHTVCAVITGIPPGVVQYCSKFAALRNWQPSLFVPRWNSLVNNASKVDVTSQIRSQRFYRAYGAS